MKKIFALLITLSLLLSSCSIDWNDEKDKKISGLEKQVTEMQKEKSKTSKEIEKLELDINNYKNISEKNNKLENCLTSAYNIYSKLKIEKENKTCKAYWFSETQINNGECWVPESIVNWIREDLESNYNKSKDLCINLYK